MQGQLTTHVLDLSQGIPAVGLVIELWRYLDSGKKALLLSVITNSDGRTETPLLVNGQMRSGEYELVFSVGDYYRKQASVHIEALFLELVPVRFHILNEQLKYHVPLLVAPGGYSTYRGS